jgi:protease-4
MVLGIVLLVVLFAVLISSAGSLSIGGEETPTVREHSVLLLNFSSGVRERQHTTPMLFGSPGGASLLDVISAIRFAARDNKVEGILIRQAQGLGLAQAREIRRELVEFKKSGKWIYALLDKGNEADYYLASVADTIFVAPLAMIEFNGFGGAVPFFKNLSDKLGVSWTVIQREEYKSAGEQFSRTRFSEPAREEILDILRQRHRVFVADVAASRGIPEAMVEQLLTSGVYQAEDFVRYGLATALATEQQVNDFLKRRIWGNDTTKKLRIVRPRSYARYARMQSSDNVDKSKAIAIIAAEGGIRSGKRSGTDDEIASASLCADIRKAADDTTIKAIILRINSPGGSAQASEEVWYELQRARAKKPVYASMSSVAASGGYYIASGCDTIIASAETVTGSIGVIAALPNFSKAMNSIGITFDTVSTSPNASFMNPLLPLHPGDQRQLERMIDTIYVRFLERVAANRKRSVDDIRTVARGRVWTGEQAAARGLVDVVGGLTDAIELAKRRIGVAPNMRPKLKFYPEAEDLSVVLKRILAEAMGEDDDNDDQARVLYQVLGISPWQRAVAEILGRPVINRDLRQRISLLATLRREPVLALMPHVIPFP